MSFFEALILGIIQGLTEFLPVSSSGHLEIGSYLLELEASNNLLFAIIVHGATALSTVIVFRHTIIELLKGLLAFKWNDETQFISKIALSMIPVGVVGVLYEKEIEALFSGNILFVGSMLAITGILLMLTHFAKEKEGKVTFLKSFIIGLAQAIAILPGISRSGATISTALLLGVEKGNAAKFSFLMVLPPILGATLLKAIAYIKAPEIAADISGLALITGFIAAFISGWLACTWMIKIVKRGKLIYFAYYCLAVAGIVFITSFI